MHGARGMTRAGAKPDLTRAAHAAPVSTHAAPAALLSARAAAKLAGVHDRTIRRAIARGDLPATKRAGIFWIDPDDFARCLPQCAPRATPPVHAPPPCLLHVDRAACDRAVDLARARLAEALSLSPRTVGWHVGHILAKLGVRTRREVAAHVHRHGIS